MTSDPINIFKPFFRTEEILDEIRDCLEKGWTGLGYKTDEFEKAWSDYTSLKNSHFINSNTSGLHLALNVFKEQYGWKNGDEVITTPLTFVSTNHAILYENLKPVFADVDEYLCLDPKSVTELINPNTKAVMFVGMGGNPGRLLEISKICKDKKIKLILDAAHMSGTFVNNMGMNGTNHVGQEADVCIFSFQAVKNLATADSGMICFKDVSNHELVKKLTWMGIDKDTYSRTQSDGSYKWKYNVPRLGFKYHGNSIMASVGLVQLKYLDQDNDRRNKVCETYCKLLDNMDEIQIIQNSEYCAKSSKHLFQILVNNSKRDGLISFMYDNNIFPGVHYIDNITYPMYNYAEGTCPKARNYSNQLLSLPLHLGLSEEDIERVVKVIRNYL